jgi:hypothetical protein
VLPCQRTFTSEPLTEGPHSFIVSSSRFGLAGPTAVRNFIVDPTAPDTLIDSGPAGLTTDSTPTFTFEAPGGGTSFTCALDGGVQAPCASPFTTGALADGPHIFNVRADNDVVGDSRSFTVDTTAPQTSITSGPAEGAATSVTRPTFTFGSSEDPATFGCTLDGTPVLCDAVFTPAAPLAEGAHVLTVAARDAAGNLAPPLVRHFSVDTTPPQTTITGGPSGTTNDPTPSFEFTASEPGVFFNCSIDGTPLTRCSSPFTPSPALTDGPHVFHVLATDAAGNTEVRARERNFTVDAAVPETSITTGPSGPTNDAGPSFEFTSTKAGSTFACSLDGAATVACQSPFMTEELADGPHTFTVVATDPAGNRDPTPASRDFSIDTTPPRTVLDSGPGPLTNDRTPRFEFSAEPGATFTCSLDGDPAAPCASPFTASPLSDAPHTLSITATDAAGNVEAAPLQLSLTVDTIAPDTRIDAGPGAETTDRRPSFSLGASEAATFACRLDGAPAVPCGASFQPAGPLGLGAHSLTVTATDLAGNLDATPATQGFRVVEGPHAPPPPESHPPLPTQLRLRASLHGRKLHVQALLSPAGTGTVRLTVSGRTGRRHLTRHLTVTLSGGAGAAILRLPPGLTRLRIAGAYGGDSSHAAASATKTVRAQPRS